MKSHESDQLKLLRSVYTDACNKCTADVSDLRDLVTVRSRVEKEGLSFLTITLPNFGKDFDKSLALGYIESTAFQGFRKTGAIPSFLRGMLTRIFDQETGRLRRYDSPEITDIPSIVEAVRQICRLFTKLEITCTPQRVHKAIEGFVQTERDLAEFTIDDETTSNFVAVSRFLWSVCLSGFNPEDITPKHGPGTTAEGASGNRKYRWRWWHERLEPYFPFLGNAYSISAAGEEEFDSVTFLLDGQELPVKVTPVPKTQKGPRIIAVEPSCMQFAQQALQAWFYKRIERARMSRGHVNFTDQSINQRIAMKSSVDKAEATADLSDASDRVPLSLVKLMILSAGGDSLWEYIDACRSRYAKLPDGRVIGPLLKFASMGSALCFPIEAMYFYTACVESLLAEQGLPVTRRNVFNVSRQVYIYGDDIIVPQMYAVAVLKRLAKYNCKVNLNKSFWNGNFRESCGVDAYDGVEVTPIYVRKLHPQNRRQHDVLISMVQTAKLFYKKGYWLTADYLYKVVERHLGSLPYVGDHSSVLGRFTYLAEKELSLKTSANSPDERWNPLYQRFEVKGWVPSPVYRTDELGDYAALQKCLLFLERKAVHIPKGIDQPWPHNNDALAMQNSLLDTSGQEFTLDVIVRDKLHLERTARYGIATLKRRWAPVS